MTVGVTIGAGAVVLVGTARVDGGPVVAGAPVVGVAATGAGTPVDGAVGGTTVGATGDKLAGGELGGMSVAAGLPATVQAASKRARTSPAPSRTMRLVLR
jgi:hypothetical protein